MQKTFILIIFILFSIFSFGQNEKIDYKIYPTDESKNDTSLYLFISNLKLILIEKDTTKLYNLLDARIVTSFGGALYGKEDFISNWSLTEPENSLVWSKMLEVIELGGVFDIGGLFAGTENDTVFLFPYANSSKLYKQPGFDFDPYTTIICVNKNVPMYKSPNTDSEIIDFLSYDILSMDYDITNEEIANKSAICWKWIYVSKTDNSITGWILFDKDFYFLGGKQLVIEKTNGNYNITGFFSYD